jgi:hypothetical protein
LWANYQKTRREVLEAEHILGSFLDPLFSGQLFVRSLSHPNLVANSNPNQKLGTGFGKKDG